MKGSSITIGTSDLAQAVVQAYEKSHNELVNASDIQEISVALSTLVEHRKTLGG